MLSKQLTLNRAHKRSAPSSGCDIEPGSLYLEAVDETVNSLAESRQIEIVSLSTENFANSSGKHNSLVGGTLSLSILFERFGQTNKLMLTIVSDHVYV